MKELSIIFVNFKSICVLSECLSSLTRQTFSNFDIYIVDNSPGNDEYQGILKLKEKFRSSLSITTFKPRFNIGFTGGNNYVLRRISNPFYFLLNCDTELAPDCIEKSIEYLKSHPNIGLLSPKVLFFDPKQYIFYAGANIVPISLKLNIIEGIFQKDSNFFNKINETGYACGAAMFIKREVVETIGLLDEIFFAYCEETDYSYRAKKKGFPTIYFPETIVYHKVKFTPNRSLHSGYRSSRFISYLTTRNYLILLIKNFPIRGLPLYLCHSGLELLLSFLHGKYNYVFTQIRAIIVGLYLGIRRLTNRRCKRWIRNEFLYLSQLNPVSASQYQNFEK